MPAAQPTRSKKNEPKVNLDPDPSSSDLSDSSSSESEPKRKKRKNKKKRRKHQKDDSSDPSSSDDSDSSEDSHYRRKRRKDHKIKYPKFNVMLHIKNMTCYILAPCMGKQKLSPEISSVSKIGSIFVTSPFFKSFVQ